MLKNWQLLASRPRVAGALNGVNAAVVGLLVAALYHPVFTSSANSAQDIVVVLAGFYLLKHLKLHIVWLVAASMLAGVTMGFI